MQNQKKNKKSISYFRNIELISVNDARFLANQSEHKKPKGLINHSKVKSKNETMSYLLEKSIREWVNVTGICTEKRVIYYERHNKKPICKEVDYIITDGDKLILGEVKVAIGNNLVVGEVMKQHSISKNILSGVFKNISFQVIIINLNLKSDIQEFDAFNEDYFNTQFREANFHGEHFKLLHLRPDSIFKYGVEKGVINNPYILKETFNEVALSVQISSLNSKLFSLNKISQNNLRNDQQLELINQIEKTKEQLIGLELKKDLMQIGWHKFSNIDSASVYSLLAQIGYSNCTTKTISKGYLTLSKNNTFNSTNHFSDVIIYSANEHFNTNISLKLLNAEIIYNKLSEQEKLEFQKLEYADLPSGSTIKLIERIDNLEFYFSDVLNLKGILESSSYESFKSLIRQSNPIIITMNANDILIINNRKMLVSI